MARKIQVKLILLLRSTGMSQRAICQSRHMSRSSVSEVFRIADEQNITYADVEAKSHAEVYSMFYPDKYPEETVYSPVDYAYVHDELKRPGVTLKRLWKEYRQRCAESGRLSFGYSKFCDDYNAYAASQNLTNRITHKPGYAIEVDWSGTKMHLADRVTGELIDVYLFVAVLPFSQYTYIEPCLDMKEASWIGCNVHMLEFFGGVPVKIVCDNLKTGVTEHPRQGEIVLNETYAEFGTYYETAIMPTAVRKPKQKASVEGAVGKISYAVIAPLRDRIYLTLEELKKDIRKELDAFNAEPFQKRDGSRLKVYENEEKACLRPLPAVPFEMAEWVYKRLVQPDCHVVFEKNYYSVPYQYVSKHVDIRATQTTVQIYMGDTRLTSHPRFPAYMTNHYSTHTEDLPEQFRDPDWNDEQMLRKAERIGTNTAIVIRRIFDGVKIREQAYNAANAVLKLEKAYDAARLEAACAYALTKFHSPRYRHLRTILNENLGVTQQTEESSESGYVRGASYYSSLFAEEGGKDR